MHVTFVLPGDYRSGGVRVTALMANELLSRGMNCRIVCPKPKTGAKQLLKSIRNRISGRTGENAGFLHLFKGNVETYSNLDDLNYAKDEVVIAVGTYMVNPVRNMKAKVIKVRFNHGMPTDPKPEHADAWQGSMPTITVSNTLIPKLEEASGEKVMAVVPNGIDREQYYPMPNAKRDGIGAVYNPHQNKSPKDMIRLLQLAHEKWPDIPQYVFSTEPCPEALQHTRYTRYPPVGKACELYNSAKVWLMTSKTEGLPGVALEAMSCGTVMVSSDNDGSLEIIRHNENGLIAPQAELDKYLEHIEAVFADDALFERLSNGATETAESMTWPRAADKMEAFLTSLDQRGNLKSV